MVFGLEKLVLFSVTLQADSMATSSCISNCVSTKTFSKGSFFFVAYVRLSLEGSRVKTVRSSMGSYF